MQQTMAVVCRVMRPSDVLDVRLLESKTTTAMARHDIAETVGTSLVAETAEELIGWLAYSLHPQHYQIHRVLVMPEFRRCGVGSMLVRNVVDRCEGMTRAVRRSFIRADVPEDDLDTHLFFAACGFEAHCYGRHYRFERWGE